MWRKIGIGIYNYTVQSLVDLQVDISLNVISRVGPKIHGSHRAIGLFKATKQVSSQNVSIAIRWSACGGKSGK
jgi:hypothetical protein